MPPSALVVPNMLEINKKYKQTDIEIWIVLFL